MTSTAQDSSENDSRQDFNEELIAWRQETRHFLLNDAIRLTNYAALELKRIDFIWGRIRFERSVVSPAIKADVRVEGHLVVSTKAEVKLTRAQRNAPIKIVASQSLQQYCVLNQILEFHGILQSLVEVLTEIEEFIDEQRHDVLDDRSSNDDVDVYVDILKYTFENLDIICQKLRDAASVLRLPSRRRFPYCSHVDLSFKPALPSEVIVDFSIHRGELLVEAFGLAASQKVITDISEGCASRDEFIGCICSNFASVFRGRKVEIVEYARVSMPIPQLEEMLVRLDDQIAWLLHVRDNVKALLDCQLLESDNL